VPEPPSALEIGGVAIAAGQRTTIKIPVARRYTHTDVFLSVQAVRGREPGPCLFVSAAIHGDEINGVEIIRRLLRASALRGLRGTLLAVPVVNVYGFLDHQRYLPDRRDLNRTFPGSPLGSMTARLAHQFMHEIVAHATHGIDLHTGGKHRTNLPQIRACLDHAETKRLASAFGVPVIIDANVRDGSLRQAVAEREIPMLLYEGGEALRFDELAIRAGLAGILSVMRAIGMLPAAPTAHRGVAPFLAHSTSWVRAPDSGVLRSRVRLGAKVDTGDRLGTIASPLGDIEATVEAPVAGIIIGRTTLPLVNEGDALFHVARFERPSSVAAQVAAFRAELDADPPST
jgi:hypothetical protein